MSAPLLPVLSFSIAFALTSLRAQSPTPITVQAVPAATPLVVAAAPAAPIESNQGTAKLLQEIKAANDAILTKQATTLLQLEEMEKAAEQIKVYSKRG